MIACTEWPAVSTAVDSTVLPNSVALFLPTRCAGPWYQQWYQGDEIAVVIWLGLQ